MRLKDIAEKCNVSIAQVSRALNNSGEVSEETRKRILDVANELLLQHNDIEGFFCMSNQMAIDCMEAVKQLKKRIPDDIKIFGFDGNAIGKYITPSLSTISQDFRKKGYVAAKLLIRIINGHNTEKTVVVPCEVLLRESSNVKAP